MTGTRSTGAAARTMVLPLALAQFIASYAASNMNVAISTIADDLGTTVGGIQTTITFFTLTMAALMIPGSKLTDIWGRKFCFNLGLIVYGSGALLAAVAPGLGVMFVGYSILEGIGSALMIPPIYILITVAFEDVASRGRYFGLVSGAAGLGSASGPLIGGLVTSAFGWRASFLLQFAVVAVILLLGRRIVEPARTGPVPAFDPGGAVLSAAGLILLVSGILFASTYGMFSWQVFLPVLAGLAVLALFLAYLGRRERSGREPLLSPRLFRNRVSNLGLATQLVQWLILQGSFFVISVFIQQVRGYDAVRTGLLLTPATVGVLLASAVAGRMARRRPQALLVRWGFMITTIGMILVPLLVRADSPVWTFLPGLFLMGFGVGVMLTASVNVVQSSFGDEDQADISGLSRSVSNLGSSLGVAIAGSVLVAAADPGGAPFAIALGLLAGISLLGLLAAAFLPAHPSRVIPGE
ncbi:MFS transporter [Paractinoplanes toevensis]|uniref:MFS transporter n=1 Tax=Paractinoplanes toevensis TaxID=571911 RepID=A0A919W966_9ACTN|nr:MFS transporter [Actinoplanes toevensis]GIM95932.1 MFS transporter [Actinoplanes toevensis]